jgi:isopentenyl diphosphate isomerase/L-lactate dehydrogenase-like FMN-dependent dehydrogenase
VKGAPVSDFQTTTEIVHAAKAKLAQGAWDYVTGGAETETSLRRNREAIESLGFRARVLRGVAQIDPSTTLFGTKIRIPYILAPVGGLQQIVEGGASAEIRGACGYGTIPTISSVTEPELEESANCIAGTKWYQLYVRGDRDWLKERIGRVRKAGFGALVVTVDTAAYSNRERQKLSSLIPDVRTASSVGAEYGPMLDWDTADYIKELCGDMPFGIKGIQHPDDATIALNHGYDILWVSNHGGRQLDHSVGSIDVLPEVVEVAAGRATIIVDGGFWRGTDILKAIALGANAVASGRMHAWALGAGGVPMLERMLELVEGEIRTSMALLGVTALSQLNPTFVRRIAYSGVTRGAFPLWNTVTSGERAPVPGTFGE